MGDSRNSSHRDGLRVVALARRLTWIGMLSCAHAVLFVLRPSQRPTIFRNYLTRCGGAFIKIGQVLAMRYDFLPIAYCESLTGLLDSLAPFPFDTVQAVLQSELGPNADRISRIGAEAVSAASVAQVHEGELDDGTRVAIKIMRPDIAQLYRLDLRLARLLARLVRFLGVRGPVDLVGLVDEIRDLAEDELDFRIEARQLRVMHGLMSRDELPVRAPAVISNLCTERVLTMEWLEGTPLTRVLRAANASRVEGAQPNPFEESIEAIASTLVTSMLVQCFSYRVFHADPHAGNLLLLDDGRLGFVDFGMVGWVDESAWARQFRLNACIARGQVDGAYQALLDALQPLPDRDLRRFEVAFKRLLRQWLLATQFPDTRIEERSSARFFLDVFEAMRKEGLALPQGDMRIHRALIVSDVLALQLAPRLDRLPILERYFRQASVEQMTADLRAAFSGQSLQDLLLASLTIPATVASLGQLARTRLPELLRRTEAGLSRAEQATLSILRLVRLTAVAGALLLLLVSLWPSGILADAADRLGLDTAGLRAIVLGANIAVALICTSLMRTLRSAGR